MRTQRNHTQSKPVLSRSTDRRGVSDLSVADDSKVRAAFAAVSKSDCFTLEAAQKAFTGAKYTPKK